VRTPYAAHRNLDLATLSGNAKRHGFNLSALWSTTNTFDIFKKKKSEHQREQDDH